MEKISTRILKLKICWLSILIMVLSLPELKAQTCSITCASSFCAGSSLSMCGPAGAAGYQWSNGQTTQCISVTAAGTYTLTVTDVNGITSTCSRLVSVKSLPSCTISGSSSICPGSSCTFCAPVGAAAYLWSTGATTQCITVSNAGTYSVTVTGTNGCTSVCSKTLSILTPPTCTITGSSTICSGSTISLCAPASRAAYLWNTGATTQCINITSAGTYTVTVTGTNGCTSTCSKTVTLSTPPSCSITCNSSFCQGSSLSLCAPSGALSYLWSTGATTQCITANTAGTYAVTVTYSSGCTSYCSRSITMNTPPSCIISGNGTICSGNSTTLCAPAGAASYQWNTGAVSSCITTSAAGTYTVTVTGTNGCSSTCTKTVTVNNPPVCSISGNSSICFGGSTQLCASAGMASYVWSTGATTQCITVGNAGTYTATITDANGCSSTCSKTVSVSSALNCAITGNGSICYGGSTQLCATAGAASYLWNTGATTQCISVGIAGTYTATITDGSGCSSTCSKTVTVNTPLTCTISGNSSFCAGGSTQLCAAAGASSYVWSTGASTQCITVSNAGTYTATVTSSNGCISTCSQAVTVNQLPVCNISGANDICSSAGTTFTASGGTSYVWSTGATTASINVSTAGTYSVTVTDGVGCSSSCSRTLTTHGCGITLRKTADICEFPYGVPTTVHYNYYIKNTGNYYSASGTLVDDNGTPGNTADDVTVCSWGPIAPGDSAICSHAFTISATTTNVAVASGTSGGSSVNATASVTVTAVNCNCTLTYPDNTNLPRSGVVFSESDVLVASDPGPANCGSAGSVIKLWYSDEHALLLGVRQVKIKTAAGTTTTYYNVTPTPSSPTCVNSPLVGDTISFGDQAGNDVADGGGRPVWPALFITDLTVNGAGSRAGDWQQGGKGVPPSKVCGTWKSAIRTIDKTKIPQTVTITTDADPNDNHWNLGTGSDVPPGGFSSYPTDHFGAEVAWNVSDLGLLPGHDYRLEFMVHDGDQNKAGGDAGETCTTIHMSSAVQCVKDSTPVTPPDSNKVCYVGTSHHYVQASQQWYYNITTDSYTIRTTFSKNFVDNTYGTNAVNWPSGHTFGDLTGSDKVQMALYDANNVKKMEFKIDYLTASNTVPSGYKSLGVTGGDGGMITGSASDVLSATTSLDKNFNTYGYVLTSNSPATNSSYAPNATYPNWIYDVWYEVTVKASVFGTAGFGRPVITSVHASPSKTGSNTELVADTICTTSAPRLGSASDEPMTPGSIKAYPNPFGNDITIDFVAPQDGDATIQITDVTGRLIESFNRTSGIITTGSELNPGIYFVRLTQNGFSKVIRIVKQNSK